MTLSCCEKNVTAFCRIAEARSWQYRLQRFLDAVRDGATIFAHPDTIDELRSAGWRDDSLRPLAFGPKVIPNQYVRKGTLHIGTPSLSKDWMVR